MKRQRPTLEMVAQRAGVSRATVSRVVNESTTVAADIRTVVMLAIQELGYVPNRAARSLARRRSDSYALVLPAPVNRRHSDNQFFPEVIRGVGEELQASESHLVLMTAGSPTSCERVKRYIMAGHVDGAVVAPSHGADPLPAALSHAGFPVVANGRPLGLSSVSYVDVDSASGVGAAVRYLISSGRHRIATIAGPQDSVAGVDRLTAYHAVLADSGRPPAVAFGDFTWESGKAAMLELLDADPEIDAVVVASDLMAHGALSALRRAGRRVPDDVAVIGFDDIELSRYTDPPLTTVHQPLLELGRTLARQLLRMVTSERPQPPVILPTTLIVRESA